MNPVCPDCGTVFEREPGYFFGAMYFSYALSVAGMVAFYFLGDYLFPGWNPLAIAALAVLAYVPLVPATFRYSRVIWMHFDRGGAPDGRCRLGQPDGSRGRQDRAPLGPK